MSDDGVSSINGIDSGETPAEAKEKYEHDLKAMDSMSAEGALQFIFTNLVLDLSYYTEAVMGQLSQTLNALTTMESQMSTMQTDFNQYQGYSAHDESYNMNHAQDTMSQAARRKYVEDAMNQATDILNEVSNNSAFSSIKSDVQTQLQNIFVDQNGHSIPFCKKVGTVHGHPYYESMGTLAVKYPNSNAMNNVDDVTRGWIAAWSAPDTPTPTSTPNSYNENLQPINDSFNSLGTDFSSVSSIAQNQLQYYEGQDQQMQGLDKTCDQSYASLESTLVRNEAAG